MATTYEVVRNGKVVDTRSEKQAAIKLAVKPGDEVRTTSGTVVHTTPKRRTMRADRFTAYTRIDAREYTELLGEGVHIPRNFDVVYLRPRQAMAMLRHQGEDKRYLVFDLQTGERHEVSTCRESAQLVKELAAKKAKAAKKSGTKKGHLTAVA